MKFSDPINCFSVLLRPLQRFSSATHFTAFLYRPPWILCLRGKPHTMMHSLPLEFVSLLSVWFGCTIIELSETDCAGVCVLWLLLIYGHDMTEIHLFRLQSRMEEFTQRSGPAIVRDNGLWRFEIVNSLSSCGNFCRKCKNNSNAGAWWICNNHHLSLI